MIGNDYKRFDSELEIENRLSKMGLSKSGLVAAADAAYLARSNMTGNHPLTAPGSVSYIEGVGAMRDALVGNGGWAKSRVNGSEYVENRALGLRIEFCNVEVASSVLQDPEPISPRKTNSRNSCHANGQQFDMLGKTPLSQKVQNGQHTFSWLGWTVQLSCHCL